MAKRRMMLSVSPELEMTLARLAELTGAAKASVAASILEDSIPQIKMLSDALEAAKNKSGDPLEMLNRALFQTIQDVSQAALDLGKSKPVKIRRAVK